MGADKEDTKGPSTATAATAGSLSASFSLDPYDLLKLAGPRISATENPMLRWAVAEEAGPWKVRRIERTVPMAGGCYHTSKVGMCLCMEHMTKVISLSDLPLTVDKLPLE